MGPLPQIPEGVKVYSLAIANVSAAGVQVFLTKIQPILSVLLLVINIAIAVATLVYTIQKIRRKRKE